MSFAFVPSAGGKFVRGLAFSALSVAAFTTACASRAPDESDNESAAALTKSEWAECGQAIDISSAVLSGGTYHGSLSGSSTGLSTCGDRTARATVLKVDLPSYGNYRIDVRGRLPETDPSFASAGVVVRSKCESIIYETACSTGGRTKSTFAGSVASGPMFVRVEGDYFASGFDLTLTKLGFECIKHSDCTDWVDGRCNQFNGVCMTPLECRGGRGNCDRNWDNGCEVDLEADPKNCGACRALCDTAGGHTTSATCNQGSCDLTCEPDWANCDGHAPNGCESNLKTHGDTCGACGQSCQGGTCDAGQCKTHGEDLATLPVLSKWGANKPAGLLGLDVGPTHVSARTDEYTPDMWAVPKANPSAAVEIGDWANDFWVDGSTTYWTTNSAVMSWSTSDQTTKSIGQLSRFQEPSNVAVVDGGLYLTENPVASVPGTPPTVRRLDGALPDGLTLWAGDGRSQIGKYAGIAVSGSRLVTRTMMWTGSSYYGYDDQFLVIDTTGAAPPAFIGELPRGRDVPFAADADYAYYGGDGVYRMNVTTGQTDRLYQNMADNYHGGVFAIAQDATHLYFATCDQGDKFAARVLRMPKSGGATEELIYDQIGDGYRVGSFGFTQCRGFRPGRFLAVDGAHVYWAAGPTIRRIAK